MNDPMFVKRYTKAGRPGVYCRVLATGFLQAGLAVRHEPYLGDRVTIPELLASYGRKPDGSDIARYLSAPLASRIRDYYTDQS
ncbi:hypothetical protein D3C87_2097970 [compost metagenome]